MSFSVLVFEYMLREEMLLLSSAVFVLDSRKDPQK